MLTKLAAAALAASACVQALPPAENLSSITTYGEPIEPTGSVSPTCTEDRALSTPTEVRDATYTSHSSQEYDGNSGASASETQVEDPSYSLPPSDDSQDSDSGSGTHAHDASYSPPASGGYHNDGNDSNGGGGEAYVHDAPIDRLYPGVHWTCDTKPATNVIPIAADKGSELYYGVTDPSKGGQYAWLTYYFTNPSVNLDHCDHVSNVEYKNGALIVTFGSKESYDHAAKSWLSDDDDLVLVGYIPGCGDHSNGDRCYFKVSGVKLDRKHLRIVAKGQSYHPDDLISKGETEWGYWAPHQGAYDSAQPTISWTASTPTATGYPSNTLSGATHSATSTAAPESGDDSFGDHKQCYAPVDTKYHLPTACLGEYFDQDLDDDLGSEPLSRAYIKFLDEVAPSLDKEDPALSKRFVGKIVKAIYKGYKAVTSVVSIPVTINKDFSWKLPDPASKDPKAKTLKDPSVKQVQSPWGDSILLKAFGTQKPDDNASSDGTQDGGDTGTDSAGNDNVQRSESGLAIRAGTKATGKGNSNFSGYMNIFCVGCGVHGTARITGRAAWAPVVGLTKGQVELNTDIQFVLKLGIDAQLKYSRTFNNDLLDFGIPGLSFGVVTIGPRISVGSRVTLEAAARGKLLAGAEMGLQNAHILIDFIEPSKSTKSGWEPYFKPTFEASGEIELSAELGLPVAIKVGIKVSKWDVSAGLVDEPSFKGVAQVAASIGLNNQGGFSAGFTETNGCTGISTSLSWRNQLYVEVTGFDRKPLFDTNDRVLARKCIELPGRDNGSPTEGDSGSQTGDNNGDNGSETGDNGDQSGENNGDGGENTETGSQPEVTRRHVSRQATDASSSTSTDDVEDITSQVKSANSTDTLSYEIDSFKNSPYNNTNGMEYAILINPNATTYVVSCSNGNLYAALIEGDDNPFCSELWASQNDTLVADGADRVLHYYNNTMSVLGVSRLRVEDTDEIPSSGVVVAWDAYTAEDSTDDDYFYLAVDPNDKVFYPIVCDFVGNIGSKIFLAEDPDKGVKLLESPDLIHTVTGGQVKACYPIWLLQGEYAADTDYASYANVTDSDELLIGE